MSAQRPARTVIKEIPRLSIYNIHGDTTNLKNISSGKVTLIDFWLIPCGPCFVEMNMLHRLYAEYKDNSNISFLTITITDSAFVRPLTENRNTPVNETYSYFETLSGLDSFRLPVYFIQEVASAMTSFKYGKGGFTGNGRPRSDDMKYPDHVFGFSGYPAIFIFTKKGKVVYNTTGFTKESEVPLQNRIEGIIKANL